MNAEKVREVVEHEWKDSIIDCLSDYIRIPNQSPTFDPQWNTNGLQEQAVELLVAWVKKQDVKGLSLEVIKDQDKSPLIFIEVEGYEKTEETTLLYGHLDKQPPMTEHWEAGLGPHKPVIKDGKLYGRGGSDDGYSIFAAVTAIKALQKQNAPHPRCVIVIEACEESGSPHLPHYINKLQNRIGTPSLVICLDSGCGDYEHLWLTTSLRGMLVGDLKVSVLQEGVHSGHGSGIVPPSERIIRRLIARIEDDEGKMLKDLYVDVPKEQQEYASASAKILGHAVYEEFKFVKGVQPVTHDVQELVLNRTWRPTLTVVGQDGWPDVNNAGNVMRTHTTLRLSIRLPPTLDSKVAGKAVKEALESNPPYGAKVEFNETKASKGWMAPKLDEWLDKAVSNASKTYYNKDVLFLGEGGSIPFMGMLGEKFPGVQFVIIGVLGPKSNAHGPNEFLHLDMAKKLTCCVSSILSDQFEHSTHKAKRRKH